MIKLVIVCHGALADGLVNAMELIAGPQPEITSIALDEGDGIDELEARVEAAVAAQPDGEGVLVLVDLFGASPFNVSARVAVRYPNVEVMTGVNLAMLLEAALQRQGCTLPEVVEIARQAGAGSVKLLSELLDPGGRPASGGEGY
jgi:PTS system mannose-specific IIA component